MRVKSLPTRLDQLGHFRRYDNPDGGFVWQGSQDGNSWFPLINFHGGLGKACELERNYQNRKQIDELPSDWMRRPEYSGVGSNGRELFGMQQRKSDQQRWLEQQKIQQYFDTNGMYGISGKFSGDALQWPSSQQMKQKEADPLAEMRQRVLNFKLTIFVPGST